MNRQEIVHSYNILCMNYLMENQDKIKYKEFFHIKTLNTMCKNLQQWKQYDLLERIFKFDNRTYLYFLKRLICLGNTKQFLYWFNKYNIDWINETPGLKYLIIQILKYDNVNLFKYFIDNFNVDKFEHDFYVKTILNIPNYKWNCNIHYIITNFLTVDDIPEPFKSWKIETLFMLVNFELEDNFTKRGVILTLKIKERQRFNELAFLFKQ